MTNFSDRIADPFVSYAVDLSRYSASVENEIRAFLLELERDLISSLIDFNPVEPIRSSYREERLRRLLKEVQQSLGQSYTGMKRHLDGHLLELSAISASASSQIVNVAIGYNLINSGLSKELLASIASNSLIDGAPSSEWWSRQKIKVLNRFKDQVRLGMAQGESIHQIVRRVRGEYTGRRYGYKTASGEQRFHSVFRGGLLDVVNRDARALVRTSIQNVAQSARLALYQDNSDVIKGVQALVTLDGRTSQICMSRSGNSWSLDGTPLGSTTERFPGSPPWHWNCRSTLIPILYEFEALAGRISERKRAQLRRNVSESTQSSIDGQVAGTLTYEAWLLNRPESFQKEVLGPSKWKLWSSGKLSFSDMVDHSGNPISVSRLKDKYLTSQN
jgi:hypothetical protein